MSITREISHHTYTSWENFSQTLLAPLSFERLFYFHTDSMTFMSDDYLGLLRRAIRRSVTIAVHTPSEDSSTSRWTWRFVISFTWYRRHIPLGEKHHNTRNDHALCFIVYSVYFGLNPLPRDNESTLFQWFKRAETWCCHSTGCYSVLFNSNVNGFLPKLFTLYDSSLKSIAAWLADTPVVQLLVGNRR